MTYSIDFLEKDDYYFAFQDGKMVNLAFDKRLVTKDYIHLLGASASMYATLGNIQTETYKLSASLDDSLKELDIDAQSNVLKLIHFLQGIQDACLNMRRLAEVGTDRLAFEIEAQNKSKKR